MYYKKKKIFANKESQIFCIFDYWLRLGKNSLGYYLPTDKTFSNAILPRKTGNVTVLITKRNAVLYKANRNNCENN